MTDSRDSFDFNELAKLGHKELIVRLGVYCLQSDELSISAPDIKVIKKATKEWFSRNHAALQDALCGKRAQRIQSVVRSDYAKAAATLYDLLATVMAGYAVALASMYLVEFGIEKFCGSSESEFLRSFD